MDKAKKVLNQLLVRCFHEVNRIEEQSVRDMTDDELSLTEIHTIEAVGNGESKKMSDVASILRITVSTLTISVNRLVNKGYVERYRCKDDKRVVQVMLTDKGKSILAEHEKFHERMIEAICNNFNDEELDIVVESMSKLLRFFSEEDSGCRSLASADVSAREQTDDGEILNYELIEG